MLNSTYKWNGTHTCSGDAQSWQFVCSNHKSTLGGLGNGGLMAGKPRTAEAWRIYEEWTHNGDMQTAVRNKNQDKGRGYIIEWRINPNVCMQQNDGNFIDLSKTTKVGINFEIQDLDKKTDGNGNWANFHHIDYWERIASAGKKVLKAWSTLNIVAEKMSKSAKSINTHPKLNFFRITLILLIPKPSSFLN